MDENIENEEARNDTIAVNVPLIDQNENTDFNGNFKRDILDSLIQFLTTFCLTIHLINAIIKVSNSLENTPNIFNPIFITNGVNFLTKVSYICVSIIIILVLKFNRSSNLINNITAIDRLLLYFLILPTSTIYIFDSLVEAIYYGFHINCEGEMFNWMNFLKGFMIIIFIWILHDFEKLINSHQDWNLKIWNRGAALLIIAICLGIYLDKLAKVMSMDFISIIRTSWNITVSVNEDCVIRNNFSRDISHLEDSNDSVVTTAHISVTLLLTTYVLGSLKWFYSSNNAPVLRSYISPTSKAKIKVKPVIIIIFLLSFSWLPYPYLLFKMNDNGIPTEKNMTNVDGDNKLIKFCANLFGIVLSLVIIMSVMLVLRDIAVNNWKKVQDWNSCDYMNLIFIWSGYIGQVLRFVVAILWIVGLKTEKLKMVDLNSWVILCVQYVFAIVAVTLQTLLVNVMIHHEYQAPQSYSTNENYQPAFLLMCCNLCAFVDDCFNVITPQIEFHTMPLEVCHQFIMTVAKSLIFIQRIHSFHFFLWQIK